MSSTPNSLSQPHVNAEEINQLIHLIQRYPAETRRILDAVEDGLTLGPALIMDDSNAVTIA